MRDHEFSKQVAISRTSKPGTKKAVGIHVARSNWLSDLQMDHILYYATLQPTLQPAETSSATKLNLWWSNYDGCIQAKTRRDGYTVMPPP